MTSVFCTMLYAIRRFYERTKKTNRYARGKNADSWWSQVIRLFPGITGCFPWKNRKALSGRKSAEQWYSFYRRIKGRKNIRSAKRSSNDPDPFKKYQDIIISTIEEKGELFGWSALVEPKAYSATVKCLKETTVYSIGTAELEQWFKDDPLMGFVFMKKIAGLIDSRLSSMRERLISSIS